MSYLDEIPQLARHALEEWQTLWSDLASRGLVLSGEYHSDIGYSDLNGLNVRVTMTLTLVQRLGDVKPDTLQLLAPRSPTMLQALSQIREMLTSLRSILDSYSGAPMHIPSGSLAQVQVTVSSGQTTISLVPALSNISAFQEQLLSTYSAVHPLVVYEPVSKLSGYAEELFRAGADVRRLAQETAEIRAEAAQAKDSAKASATFAESQAESVIEVLGEARTGSIELDAVVTTARETSKALQTLQSQVDTYAAKFQAFKADFDETVAELEKFRGDTNTAMSTNKERENEIARLIAKADSMIRGATTAGLSASLDEAASIYTKALNAAQWQFIVSVLVLAVFLAPVVGQIIPGPWQEWFKPPTGITTDPWLATLGKLVLLIPATWATAFFAKKYSLLFHLAREYSHKAALAKAVEGFKREAPEYEQEIVTGVFMEIRENPSARATPDPAKPENPFLGRVLDKIAQLIEKRASAKS